MSQYGAQAQALAGRSAATILATYYRGTALTSARDNADIRVQVVGDRTSTRITTSVVDELGGRFVAAVGTHSLLGRAGDALTVTTTSTGVRAALRHAGRTTSLSGARLVVRWQGTRAMAGPATLVHVSGAPAVYRWGRLEISKVLGLVNVVNVLRLHDEYLDGLDEVPASWKPAALQAQAMAARTYAIKALAGGVSARCDCHVYDDTRSQVFHGWSREGQPTWGARWSAAVKATAASATTGRIITYGGKPIDAVYFSSDGGRTENSEDVWAGRVPYLRSVADPWSAGGGNPLARWSRTRSQAQVAVAFRLPDVASLDLSDRTAGGGVVTAVATSSGGQVARIGGRTLAGRLGLPSWWVSRSATRIAGAAKLGHRARRRRAARRRRHRGRRRRRPAHGRGRARRAAGTAPARAAAPRGPRLRARVRRRLAEEAARAEGGRRRRDGHRRGRHPRLARLSSPGPASRSAGSPGPTGTRPARSSPGRSARPPDSRSSPPGTTPTCRSPSPLRPRPRPGTAPCCSCRPTACPRRSRRRWRT